MTAFDESQRAVIGLDPGRHARVLGAPGSGKTTVLVECYARAIDRPGWSEAEVLALAPSRLAASSVRSAIETRVGRALGGSSARSFASLAFSVLAQAAAVAGLPAPRLLTGTVQDEAIATVIERGLERGGGRGVLAPEIVRSAAFRAELREFWRVLDDFDLDPEVLLERCERLLGQAASEALTAVPDDERLGRWIEALQMLVAVQHEVRAERPGELSTSALLRAAGAELRSGRVAAPRLLLVDDAQELGEGELALLAACAAAGSRVWVFGDPDTATESFHGERTRVMADLSGELSRRGAIAASGPVSDAASEQRVVLDTVHRHGAELRELVRDLSRRIGSAGVGLQREARASGSEPPRDTVIDFAIARSPSEQLGIIAHRLRRRRLGVGGGEPASWNSMAVVCRSRVEAVRLARGLAGHQVPTGVAAGGIVLREHRIVRDLIRLLRHARGVVTLASADVLALLGGPVGGLDPVAVRRLRGALMLQERRVARADDRAPLSTDELVLRAFADPLPDPSVDSRGGRALRRLGRIAAAGVAVAAAGGTPRETLWAIWDRTGLAVEWQEEALTGRGHRADEAHRSLDAVLGLFFALQRHEEQASDTALDDLLEELLESAVPEDSLARQAERDAVIVTTPQGAVGREFDTVVVIGAQDGAWPNTRARGTLLGTIALERWLRGGDPSDPSRRDTIHDELRLFTQACSRAGRELLVVAVRDDEHHPSPFFGFGAAHLRETLPSSRLTLRGATADLRRRLVADPHDEVVLAGLAALARAESPGAHPDEWYGVLPPSCDEPLHDVQQPDARVPVSPSQMERAEECPLDWVISSLGGGESTVAMNLGTLVHHAFETAQGTGAAEMLEAIEREWHKLPFEAEWESARMRDTAEAMAGGLAAYLQEFAGSDRELIGRETSFGVAVGHAELRGMVDRIESRATSGGLELSVVDLKTGATLPSGPATERHVQLQAYQLATALGAFDESVGATRAEPGANERATALSTETDPVIPGGARLLFVHPDATKGGGYVERAQAPLDAEARQQFADRVTAIAETMAAAAFTARVEHHCTDRFAQGSCRIHIVPAVSHA